MTDLLTPTRREHFPVLRDVPTRWTDHDTYGHVNNAVYLVLIDTAVNGWLIEASGADIRQLPAIGVVIESNCRYLTEIRFPQRVTLGIALASRGTSSVRYDLALFTDAETPAAVARFNHVYVDPHTRRPVPIPPEIDRALRQLTRAAA